MTKKADAPAEKKKSIEPKAEPKPKVRTARPSSNPFTEQRPGSPNRSANNGQPGSRRGR
ncbi:MAG: hypothetical protein Q8N23_05760 [Archangium sp.]|nr:hypothetical protein [Archangium sp.]MDP3574963.1 hypothetical protein [Archangium sp.]